jgi:hypothetical protein
MPISGLDDLHEPALPVELLLRLEPEMVLIPDEPYFESMPSRALK